MPRYALDESLDLGHGIVSQPALCCKLQKRKMCRSNWTLVTTAKSNVEG